jgi:hypothetical protein
LQASAEDPCRPLRKKGTPHTAGPARIIFFERLPAKVTNRMSFRRFNKVTRRIPTTNSSGNTGTHLVAQGAAPFAGLFAANVYHPPRKGYQQDAAFAASKVELRGARKLLSSPVFPKMPQAAKPRNMNTCGSTAATAAECALTLKMGEG